MLARKLGRGGKGKRSQLHYDTTIGIERRRTFGRPYIVSTHCCDPGYSGKESHPSLEVPQPFAQLS